MKKMITGLVAGLLATSAHAQTITDAAAFNGAIETVRKGNASTDKFAEPIRLPIEGKAFKLTMAPEEWATEGGGALLYDYKDGALVLDLSPTTVWPLLAGPKERLPALKVSSTTANLGSSLGQNAFGAVAEVRTFRNKGAAIAILNSPKPMISPRREAIGAKYLEDTDWWVRLDLPPAQAKAMAADAIAVVEGTFAPLPNGQAGACHFGGVSATIRNPTNYSSEVCYVGANITRIAITRKSTGEVLKEWTLDNSPRLGPVLWDKVRVGMTPRELKAIYPTFEGDRYGWVNGASLTLDKGVVSKVEVQHDGPERGKAVVKLLTTQYGAPIASRCIGATLCEGEWKVSDGVVVYLSITNRLSYQEADAPPPVGYNPR
ncbi:hypothetical protein ACH0BU_15805 [Sphingomonas olei]